MKKTVLVCLALAIISSSCSENKPMEPIPLYVGTYTDSESEGIYRYSFDPNSGTLSTKTLVATVPNPSFLKISNDNKYLYAVQETDGYDSIGGGVSAFRIEEKGLETLNSQSSGGAHPCHIAISRDGRQLAVSNYTGGNLAVLPIQGDGSLGKDKQLIDHKILDSTKTSHVHSAKFTPDGLFIADLGLDAIHRYRQADERFMAAEQSVLNLPEGAGPRHFNFGQKGKFLYVINELNSSVTVFKRDGDGAYAKVIAHSTVAADFKGESFCADIHLSADGKFLYGSNRGENTIVVFLVNQETGDLALVDRTFVEGDWPRNFTLDPTGKFLLIANQKSDNITVFSRDVEKGTLTFLNETALPMPVSLEFLK